MELPIHNLPSLFEQLGLENSESAIDKFIGDNLVPDHILLHEANFWNSSQASFLKQAIEEDSDWSEVVDELNILLRNKTP